MRIENYQSLIAKRPSNRRERNAISRRKNQHIQPSVGNLTNVFEQKIKEASKQNTKPMSRVERLKRRFEEKADRQVKTKPSGRVGDRKRFFDNKSRKAAEQDAEHKPCVEMLKRRFEENLVGNNDAGSFVFFASDSSKTNTLEHGKEAEIVRNIVSVCPKTSSKMMGWGCHVCIYGFAGDKSMPGVQPFLPH